MILKLKDVVNLNVVKRSKGLRKVNNRSKLETIWKSLSKTHLGRLEIANKSKTVKINIK